MSLDPFNSPPNSSVRLYSGDEINIQRLDKRQVLKTLWDCAKAADGSHMRPMTLNRASELIALRPDDDLRFGYVDGKWLDVDISGDSFVPDTYHRHCVYNNITPIIYNMYFEGQIVDHPEPLDEGFWGALHHELAKAAPTRHREATARGFLRLKSMLEEVHQALSDAIGSAETIASHDETTLARAQRLVRAIEGYLEHHQMLYDVVAQGVSFEIQEHAVNIVKEPVNELYKAASFPVLLQPEMAKMLQAGTEELQQMLSQDKLHFESRPKGRW